MVFHIEIIIIYIHVFSCFLIGGKNSYISGASLGGPVRCASNWLSGGPGFDPWWVWQLSFMETAHEIFSTVILSLPLIQEEQLSVSDERMCKSTGPSCSKRC